MVNGSTGGPVPMIDPAMLAKIMTPRDLIDELGGYLAPRFCAEPVEPIRERVAGLNPCAWPPCKHCGGNVNDCNNYDPDTSAPLWGSKESDR